jgi:hypothetical protein
VALLPREKLFGEACVNVTTVTPTDSQITSNEHLFALRRKNSSFSGKTHVPDESLPVYSLRRMARLAGLS